MKTPLLVFVSFLFGMSSFAQRAAMAFNKMNTVYTGIANPLSIVAEKTKCKDLIITTDNGFINPNGNCEYTYWPKHEGTANILVSLKTANGSKELYTAKYRVKMRPAPTVRLNGRTSGEIPRSLLCYQVGPSANVREFDFYGNYVIYKCKIIIVKDSEIIFEKTINDTTAVKFDEETKKILCSLKAGSVVWLTDIACKDEVSNYPNLNDIKLTVTD